METSSILPVALDAQTVREILLDIQGKVTRISGQVIEHEIILRGDLDSMGLIERTRVLESNRRALMWVASALVVLVIGLLFQIVTGRIDLVMP